MDTNIQAASNGSAQADLIAQLAQLREENDKLKAKAAKAAISRLKLKVTEKGGISLYGMGRFPVTLYRGQWEKLLEFRQEVLDFITDHADELSTKD